MKDHDFERSVCACAGCIKCCKVKPGPLKNGDFEQIVEFIQARDNLTFDEAKAWVRKRLCASPGALVIIEGIALRIGTITPIKRKGKCIFLNDNDRCDIHPVSPFGCSHFDTHMSDARAKPRQLFLIDSQLKPEYQALRESLPLC